MKLELNDIKHSTLKEVKALFEQERISEETARAYCKLWNETAFRFTEARVEGWTIRQFERE